MAEEEKKGNSAPPIAVPNPDSDNPIKIVDSSPPSK